MANYIKERTKNAQFIVISLRNNMFELAARLVGVYKVNHMTRSVTIENRDYIRRSGAPPQPGGQGNRDPGHAVGGPPGLGMGMGRGAGAGRGDVTTMLVGPRPFSRGGNW